MPPVNWRQKEEKMKEIFEGIFEMLTNKKMTVGTLLQIVAFAMIAFAAVSVITHKPLEFIAAVLVIALAIDIIGGFTCAAADW